MKKLFSVIAVVLFISTSSFSLNGPTSYEDCFGVAKSREFIAVIAGFTFQEAYEMGNNAYDSCIDDVNLYYSNQG